MKPLPSQAMHGILVMIIAATALTNCSSNGTYLSKPVTMSDLRAINPRGYLNALPPHDRETAAMEIGSRELESRRIERRKLSR